MSLSIICSQRKFRTMQMRWRRYIRFDFAQALHTRAMRGEHRDYRIIARARTFNRSLMRALACGAELHRETACVGARSIRGAIGASSHESRFAHIFLVSPRIVSVGANTIAHVRAPRVRLARNTKGKAICRGERIKSKRRARSSQSNFSSSSLSHFCRRDVAIADSRARNAAGTTRFAARDSTSRQRPSRFLSASLTARGLALPPVDFIT
jgi:hypothetical protein